MLDFILNVMNSYAWSGLYIFKFILVTVDKIGYRSQNENKKTSGKKKKESRWQIMVAWNDGWNYANRMYTYGTIIGNRAIRP